MISSIVRGLSIVAVLFQGPQAPAPAPAVAPTAADLALTPKGIPQNWPMFRGLQASGIADNQGAVVEWNVTTGKNIRWQTPLPGVANSSPLIWGNRVYVANAISSSGDTRFQAGPANVQAYSDVSEHSWRLYALDAATGAIVWDKEVYKGAPRTKRHAKGSQAAGTPVTDGRRISVLFGTAGILATFDTNGNQLWKKDIGGIDAGYIQDPTQQWGHAASPILYQNTVIIQADQQKGSYIAAFDAATGAEVWKTMRDDEQSTWGTPLVVTSPAGDELITNGAKMRGYDAKTGKLRWTLAPGAPVNVPTPVAANNLVYVTSGYQLRPIYAIRPGGSGDISLAAGATSNANIAWSVNRDGPYLSSPIVYRGILYSLHNNGALAAYDALTGESIYRGRVGAGGAFSASPIAADGRLYFANEDGQVYVVRAGKEYVQIAINEMGEPITATPAISDGLMVVRTVKGVYGIGTK
jgi:outer membrane protein assembly factor BamB